MKHKWVLEIYTADHADKPVQCPVKITVESDINLSIDDEAMARTALVNTDLWAKCVAVFRAAS